MSPALQYGLELAFAIVGPVGVLFAFVNLARWHREAKEVTERMERVERLLVGSPHDEPPTPSPLVVLQAENKALRAENEALKKQLAPVETIKEYRS